MLGIDYASNCGSYRATTCWYGVVDRRRIVQEERVLQHHSVTLSKSIGKNAKKQAKVTVHAIDTLN